MFGYVSQPFSTASDTILVQEQNVGANFFKNLNSTEGLCTCVSHVASNFFLSCVSYIQLVLIFICLKKIESMVLYLLV